MTDPRSLYHATLVEHDRAPRHEGPLPEATHAATIDNPMCGDVVTIRLVLDGDRIAQAAFEGRGCSLARAGASIATDRAIGATTAELRELAAAVDAHVSAPFDAPIPDDLGDAAAFAGVRAFKSRRVCATLAFRALTQALASPT